MGQSSDPKHPAEPKIDPGPGSGSDYLNHLVLELRTHQAELEVQNEELRAAHEELLQAKRLYADLFDFAPVGYVTVNEQSTILEANGTMVTMAGVNRASLVGRNCVLLFHIDDRDTVYLFLRSLAQGQPALATSACTDPVPSSPLPAFD